MHAGESGSGERSVGPGQLDPDRDHGERAAEIHGLPGRRLHKPRVIANSLRAVVQAMAHPRLCRRQLVICQRHVQEVGLALSADGGELAPIPVEADWEGGTTGRTVRSGGAVGEKLLVPAGFGDNYGPRAVVCAGEMLEGSVAIGRVQVRDGRVGVEAVRRIDDRGTHAAGIGDIRQ